MLGIKHIKFDSMTYVLHFTNGKIKNEGRGLSFFYFAPNSSIAAIPMGSNDLPFIFSESTNDYQTVNIQGQISYKISNPKTLADVLDFTVNDNGQYKKNDIEKLNQRIINEAQTATSSFIHEIKLKDAIRSAKSIEEKILDGLKSSKAIAMLGIDILGGDFAPDANISGAILAKKELPNDVRLVLIGDRDQISSGLLSYGEDVSGYDIVHAPDVITMHDHPTRAIPQKPNSSIAVGFDLLAAKRRTKSCKSEMRSLARAFDACARSRACAAANM